MVLASSLLAPLLVTARALSFDWGRHQRWPHSFSMLPCPQTWVAMGELVGTTEGIGTPAALGG
jgi:hypothetical protein